MSFKAALENCKVEALNCTISLPGEPGSKYLIFTKYSEVTCKWILGASDGIDIWKTEIDEDDIDTNKDIALINSKETYFNHFSTAFKSQQLSLLRVGVKIVLTIGVGTSSFSFDLYETTAADRKTELKEILFGFVEKCDRLVIETEKLAKKIESLQACGNKDRGGHLNLDSAEKNFQTKLKPKKVGMSVINPNSRKRKAAVGVQFDQ